MKGLYVFAAQFVATATFALGASTDDSHALEARDFHIEKRDGVETHIFKRDANITERDIELAELNGVDLTKMYKHSVIKRDNDDDDDDLTIWVSNSFEDMPHKLPETDTPGQLSARQLAARPVKLWKNLPVFAPWSSNCWDVSYVGLTNPSAPFTGGVLEMMRFTDRSHGGWSFTGSGLQIPRGWHDLLIGGSNSGANAVFKVDFTHKSQHDSRILVLDVNRILTHVHNRYRRKYGQSWRVSAKGHMTCDAVGIYNWEFDWELLWTRQNPFQ